MNRGRMLILAAIALILSIGVTYLTYRVLQTRLKPSDETLSLVVATKKLSLGTRLTAEDVKAAQWPASVPIEGAFQNTESVIGRAVLISMEINEPLLETKLAPKEGGAGLIVAIPEGMRALSIQVNNVIGVAGFVLPGTRVDLILTAVPPKGVATRAGRSTSEEEMAAKIILENLQVIAAGQNVQQDINGQPQTVQVVTLLVTPEQAEKVALATGDGRIQLALRNPLDLESVDPPVVFRSSLYDGSKAEQAPKPAPRPSPTTRRAAPQVVHVATVPQIQPAAPLVLNVELIQGAKRVTETFEEKKPEQKKP